MTGDDMPAALRAIGWTQRELARRLGCDEKLIRRWLDGEAAAPPAICRWLGRMQHAIERLPPPSDWRQR